MARSALAGLGIAALRSSLLLALVSAMGCDPAALEPDAFGPDAGAADASATDGAPLRPDAPPIDAPTGCDTDADCDDGDPATANRCVDLVCRYETAPCSSAFDCEDFDACTTDACLDGACRYEPIVDCAGCRSDAECDDGDGSTFDVCDTFTRSCLHLPGDPFCDVPADCDDGNVCTDDQCNGSGTCAWGSVPDCCFRDSDCDDGNDCTLDACDLVEHTCDHVTSPSCAGCPDRDGDGYGSVFCFPSGRDCDDGNAMTHPGATELCENGIDDDCDGMLDGADETCDSDNDSCESAVALPIPGATRGTIVSAGFTATGCGSSLFYTLSVTELSDVSVHFELGDIVDPPCPGCTPPRHEIWHNVLVERACGDAATAIGALAGAGSCRTFSPDGGFFSGPREHTIDLRRVVPGTYTIEIQARDFFPSGSVAIPFDLTVSAMPSAGAVCDGAPLVDGETIDASTLGGADAFGVDCRGAPFTSPEEGHPLELTERRRVRLLATPELAEGGRAPAVHLALRDTCDPDEAPSACVDSRGYCFTSAAIERILEPGSYVLDVQSPDGPVGYALSMTTESVGAACAGAATISASGAYSGTTVGAVDHFRWNDVCGGGASGEVVYVLAVAVPSRVVLDLISSAASPLLRVVTGCGEADVAGSEGRTRIDRTFEPGSYQVIVDGAAVGDAASYVLNATMLPM